jgi:RNA polymerase sigma-B factor
MPMQSTYAPTTRSAAADRTPGYSVKQLRQMLFHHFSRTKDPAIREQLVFEYVGLVRHLASRFAKRAGTLEDLVQVGMIGLINAIDRFDPARGFDFTSFAVPTVVGEIKRHFRDKSWAMRVPRRLKDLNVRIGRTVEDLTVSLGRPPTHADLAQRLGVTVEEIIEAQESSRAYVLQSLDADAETSDRPRQTTVGDHVGDEDRDLALLLDKTILKDASRRLESRERVVVYLRFFANLSQSEVGRRLGCTQMHVSRLQRRALEKMRRAAETASQALGDG